MGSAMGLGINFFVSVIVGGAMGYGLDVLLGTKPWIMLLVGIPLGFAAAFRELWRFMNKIPSPPPSNPKP
jgi:ATP synthase protein I